MTKKILYVTMAVFAVIVGLYPAVYFFVDRKFGLLASKDNAILESVVWNSAFYSHIILGGIALLVGWIQFNDRLRSRNVNVHRIIGKIYVICALISAASGLYIALYATGGLIAKTGFLGLSMVWFYTTWQGYRTISKGQVIRHQVFMIYSYAACLAAVTLRIWLPILVILLHGFIPGYRIVSWLCWVPNLIIAFLIVRKKKLLHSYSVSESIV